MRDHHISQRRACDLVGVDPKTVRRDRPPDYADIRKKMHEIAEKRRRFGYRRIGVMLERDGFTMNEKKLHRIYREEGLSVRRRRGRKRARGTRTPMPIPNVTDGVDAPRRHRCAKVAGVEAPQRRRASMGEVSIIGLDLAKNVFQAHGAGANGSVCSAISCQGRSC